MPTLNLGQPQLVETPFPHFATSDCIDSDTANTLLQWFETEAPWRDFKDDFYEFEGVNLHEVKMPSDLAFLVEDPFIDSVRSDFERIFNTRLGKYGSVGAQRMRVGRDIAIHSDFGPERQTHRLVVQLNRGWVVEQGGILMLFDEEAPERVSDRQCFYLPAHRSAVGFAISARSYHAVSRVREGDRYSLCISFLGDV